MSKKDAAYDATAIEVLQNIEHIRARPGMYIADTRKAGLLQLSKEIIDNSVDEFLAGHCDRIDVVVDVAEGWVQITDNGRGIPVDIHPKTKMSALATVFMLAGAGGKFNSQAYSTSAGLHGVGVTVVNALSSKLTVWSLRGGKQHRLDFERGKCKQSNGVTDIEKVDKNWFGESGTRVRFVPDEEVFKKVQIDVQAIADMLEHAAYLCSGLTLTIRTVDGEFEHEFHQEDGLKGFVEHQLAANKQEALHAIQTFKNDSIEAAFVWTDGKDETWHSYVNCSPTPEGGTHQTGLKRLITNAVAPKAVKAVESDDLRVGLVVALHCKVKQPQFKGQTKTKLQNKETESEVYEALKDTVNSFVTTNQRVIESIINRAAKLKSARDRFEREKDASKNIVTFNRNKKGVLPGKLAEAPNCAPEDRELFLVEGESAGGSAKQARHEHQEVLGLKGKIPNAQQKAKTALFENEEIQSIITAIGAGVGEKCDPKKARIGKLMLLMDADPDGSHITALMLAFLNRYMAPIIDAGMVWVVQSPLFRAVWKDQVVYGDSVEECLKHLPRAAKPTVTRFKGHGEANVEDIQHYAMNASTRKLLRVDRDALTDEAIAALMGQDSDLRKSILGLSEDT